MPDWGFIAAGLFVLALGLSVLLWALFSDRSKGRERCPGCWYDMSGAPGDAAIRCPECGRAAYSRREFRRTRRRWRLAVLALFLVASGPAILFLVVRRSGWWALMPTEALVRTMDVSAAESTAGRTEFGARLKAGEVTDRQWQIALARAIPTAIRTRPKWPVGVPIWCDFEMPMDLIDVPGTSMNVTFDNQESGPDASRVYVQRGSLLAPASIYLAVPQNTSTGELVIDVSGTLSVRPLLNSPSTTAWSATFSEERPIQLTSTVDECITPVIDPVINEMIRSKMIFAIGWQTTPTPDGTSTRAVEALSIHGDEAFSALSPMCFAIRLEFIHDGTVVASLPFLWPQGENEKRALRGNRQGGIVWLDGDSQTLTSVNSRDPKWTIRIVADPELALRDVDATRYWSGSIELPFPRRYQTVHP